MKQPTAHIIDHNDIDWGIRNVIQITWKDGIMVHIKVDFGGNDLHLHLDLHDNKFKNSYGNLLLDKIIY